MPAAFSLGSTQTFQAADPSAWLEEALPVADGVLSPPWARQGDDWELFGYSLEETRKFAGTCLMRRLKVIGLR